MSICIVIRARQACHAAHACGAAIRDNFAFIRMIEPIAFVDASFDLERDGGLCLPTDDSRGNSTTTRCAGA